MSTLKKTFLALSIASFLFTALNADEPKGVTVRTLAKSTKSWDGDRLPAYPGGRPEITILRIAIPAGARLDMHKHHVINAGVLLSGSLTVVTKDGKKLKLRAGDPIVEVVEKWHYGVNEGATMAEIIVFYAGTEGTSITVKMQKE